MHVIAAKATAFLLAATPEFKDRQERTKRGAAILAERLTASDAKAAGIDVLTGGTDVHLVLVDLRTSEMTGKDAEDRLHEVGITVNKNAVPNDPRPPMVTSGVRIGTPALATRGFGDAEFTEVADIIAHTLMPDADIAALSARVVGAGEEVPALRGPHLARNAGSDGPAPRRPRHRLRDQGGADDPGRGAARAGRRPGPRHPAGRRRSRDRSATSGGKHRDSAEVGHRVDSRRPAGVGVRGGGEVGDRRAQQRLVGHRLHRAVAAPGGHRRERDARTDRSRQGCGRASPDQPRSSRARGRRRAALAAAVHPGGHRRVAAPPRRADRGQARRRSSAAGSRSADRSVSSSRARASTPR